MTKYSYRHYITYATNTQTHTLCYLSALLACLFPFMPTESDWEWGHFILYITHRHPVPYFWGWTLTLKLKDVNQQSCQFGLAECQNAATKGSDYTGWASRTKSGHICQAWSSDSPHGHDWKGLEGNLCRNPDGEAGVWCYTSNPAVRWQLCDVPHCTGKQIVRLQFKMLYNYM